MTDQKDEASINKCILDSHTGNRAQLNAALAAQSKRVFYNVTEDLGLTRTCSVLRLLSSIRTSEVDGLIAGEKSIREMTTEAVKEVSEEARLKVGEGSLIQPPITHVNKNLVEVYAEMFVVFPEGVDEGTDGT